MNQNDSQNPVDSAQEAVGRSDDSVGAIAFPWFSPLRFAGILAILIVSMYPDVIFLGKSFFFRDFCLFGYPLASYHRDCFWRGEIPLWNPLSACGLPYLAQWNTLTLYPLSLVYLLIPLPGLWDFSVSCTSSSPEWACTSWRAAGPPMPWPPLWRESLSRLTA
jgi:hypothetical protein